MKISKKIKKILVANRAEIALRIMRSAKKMGIKTVAIFSEADREAPHTLFADEAYFIGKAASSESYLVHEKIIDTALKCSADAIHPGYGFLSENADFVQKVEKAGLVFIGPSSESIRIMGNKLLAKKTVLKYNIPMVPGVDQAITNVAQAKSKAVEIGYPILIKAAAGGGGKGMRIVYSDESFEEEMNRAVSEAQSSFGDGAVFIEKYVTSPRHIEIQILADKHGNVVHLFERECSIQRRHQKVIEEAPSAILSESLRKQMGESAINVARSCDYVGAGTVEFLLDKNFNYYFLEMNTRLQVEHPVTEFISDLDLVEEQIKVAQGEKLSFQQNDLKIKGHAIELRVYAEDPKNNFLPSIGQLEKYRKPTMKNVRVDDGYREGMSIPLFYDPMISKLIAYGKNRLVAIALLKKAILEYEIEGIETTLSFGSFVLNHPSFVNAEYDTHFVKNHYEKETISNTELDLAIAKIGLFAYLKESKQLNNIEPKDSQWK